MSVASIQGEVLRSRGTPQSQGSTVPVGPGKSLGKDDFLRLLVTQMRYQVATDPLDQKAFLDQMTQFASLEQIQNLNASISGVARLQSVVWTSALIGRHVEAVTQGGTRLSGVVSSVEVSDGVCRLVVGDKRVDLADIVKVT